MNGNDKLSRYAVVRISITRKIHICGRETFDHPSQSFMFRSKLFRENHVKFDRAGEGCSLFGFHFNGYLLFFRRVFVTGQFGGTVLRFRYQFHDIGKFLIFGMKKGKR